MVERPLVGLYDSFSLIPLEISTVVPYFVVYQIDKPVVPFICTDLSNMLKGVMNGTVKSEKLSEAAKSTDELVRLKLEEENIATAHMVDMQLKKYKRDLWKKRKSLNKNLSVCGRM